MDLLLAGSVLPVDLVVFDCDGVLLDTMSAKIEAFRTWVPAEHREHREAFMSYVMASFGRSRTFHVEHFYRDLAGLEPEPGFLEAEVGRFTAICEPMCESAGWRSGSLEFVRACRAAKVLRCVLSGAPQGPLEAMLGKAPGYETDFFHRIVGSPPGKAESLEKLLADAGTPAHRAVFIGDAEADRQAAQHVGAHFVYFPSEAKRPEAAVATEVKDLRDLLAV